MAEENRPPLLPFEQLLDEPGAAATQQLADWFYRATVLLDALQAGGVGAGAGRSIQSIARDDTSGVVTVTYTDGTTDEFTVAAGLPGSPGVMVSSIATAANGDVTVTFSDGRSFTVPAGAAGRGIASVVRAADGTVTVTYDDATTDTFPLRSIVSIVRDAATGIVTATYSDGATDAFTVNDGDPGTPVDVSSIVTEANGDIVVTFSDGSSFTIPAANAGRGIMSIARDAQTGVVTVTYDDATTDTFGLRDIATIARNAQTGVVTVTYRDGSTDEFTVNDGEPGSGVAVTSIVTEADGDIVVTFSDGQAFTIPAGSAGRGIGNIARNADTGVVTVTYDDNSTDTFGLRDIAGVARNADTGVVTITYSDGATDTFTVNDGTPGTSIALSSIVTETDGDVVVTFSDGQSFTIPAGAAGRGIDNIARNAATGVVTVTYDDATTETFTVADGAAGAAGPNAVLLPYDDRRQASISGGGNGQWLPHDSAAAVILTHPIPWDDIASVKLSARDNDGQDFARVFRAGLLANAGHEIAFERTAADGALTRIAYLTSGPVVHDDTDNSYTFPLTRDDARDAGDPATVQPQIAAEYALNFSLPMSAFVVAVSAAIDRTIVALDRDADTGVVTLTRADGSTDSFTVQGGVPGTPGASITIVLALDNADGSILLLFSDGTQVTVPPGAAGRGIMNIARNADTGVVTITYDDATTNTFPLRDIATIARNADTGVVTVTYRDGASDTFTVSDGEDGNPGVTIDSITTEADGDVVVAFSDGQSFTIPAGSAGRGIDNIARNAGTGVVTVTYDDAGTDTFPLRDIAGIARNADTGVVTVTYRDGTSDTFTVSDGEDGNPGTLVSSIVTEADGDVVVTFSDGQSFTIPAGSAGRGIDNIARNAATGVVTITYDDGATDTFGLRSIASVVRNPDTGVVTITYTDGATDTFTVADGTPGSSVTITSIATAANGDVTVTFSDGSSFTIPAANAGRGIMSIARDAQTGVVTVTYDDATTDTFTVPAGEPGTPAVAAQLASQTAEWMSRDGGATFTPAVLSQDIEIAFLRAGATAAQTVVRGTRDGSNVSAAQTSATGEAVTHSIENNASPRVVVTVTHTASSAQARAVFEAAIEGEGTTVGDPPAQMARPTLTVNAAGNQSVLNWVAPDPGDSPITIYQVRLGSRYIDIADPAARSFDLPGLLQNAAITAQVRAGSLIGFGGFSDSRSGNAPNALAPLGPPAGLQLFAFHRRAGFLWVFAIWTPVTGWPHRAPDRNLLYYLQHRPQGSTNWTIITNLVGPFSDLLYPRDADHTHIEARIQAVYTPPFPDIQGGYGDIVAVRYDHLPSSNGALTCDTPDDVTGIVGEDLDVAFPEGAGGSNLVHSVVPLYPGMAFDPATRRLTGSPAFPVDTDAYYVITEGSSAQINREFRLTIAGPPDPPDDLRSGGNRGATFYRLRWDAAADNGSAVTDYDIRFRSSAQARWINWVHIGADTEALVTGLTAGTVYQVQVRAENAAGDGEWSEIFRFSTAAAS